MQELGDPLPRMDENRESVKFADQDYNHEQRHKTSKSKDFEKSIKDLYEKNSNDVYINKVFSIILWRKII